MSKSISLIALRQQLFKLVFDIALLQSSRDVFDRLITAEAIVMDIFLITKDKKSGKIMIRLFGHK